MSVNVVKEHRHTRIVFTYLCVVDDREQKNIITTVAITIVHFGVVLLIEVIQTKQFFVTTITLI